MTTPNIGRSAKVYQERKGHRPTLSGPGPHLNLHDNAARSFPLVPPLPLPETLYEGQPPDAGLTKEWPWGKLLYEKPVNCPQPLPSSSADDAPPTLPAPGGPGSLPATASGSSPSVFSDSLGSIGDPDVAPLPSTRTVVMDIGMNLDSVNYYERMWFFNDLAKVIDPWRLAWADDPLPADAFGMPSPPLTTGQSALSELSLQNNGYPTGDYLMTYSGTGNIAVTGTPVTVNSPGNVTLHYNNTSLLLKLTGQVSDLHIWMPNQQSNPLPFHPVFLSVLQPFTAIRFMDPTSTNNSIVVNWADRTLPTQLQGTVNTTKGPGAGLAWEYCFALANACKADAWINIPHLATDAYVTALGALAAQQLNSGLKVWVEYSNELWNSVFKQSAYALAQGQVAFPALPEYNAQRVWIAQQAKHVQQLFIAAFTAAGGNPADIVKVWGMQYGDSWGINYVLTQMPSLQGWFDKVAMAPYFALKPQISTQPLADACVAGGLDAVFNGVSGQFAGLNASIAAQVATNAACAMMAVKYGMELVAYEGGQSLVAIGNMENDAALVALFSQAQSDPRMGQCYQTHLAQWHAATPGRYFAFDLLVADSKFGDWGALTMQTGPATVKYAALLQALQQGP